MRRVVLRVQNTRDRIIRRDLCRRFRRFSTRQRADECGRVNIARAVATFRDFFVFVLVFFTVFINDYARLIGGIADPRQYDRRAVFTKRGKFFQNTVYIFFVVDF